MEHQRLDKLYKSFNKNERHVQGGRAGTRYGHQDNRQVERPGRGSTKDIWSNLRLEIQQSGVSKEQQAVLHQLHQMYKNE